MLGSRQTDWPDVIGEHDRLVQLHQGDVVVKSVGVVVRVGDDLLQASDCDVTCDLSLRVKAEVSFPGPSLREPDDTQEEEFDMSQV